MQFLELGAAGAKVGEGDLDQWFGNRVHLLVHVARVGADVQQAGRHLACALRQEGPPDLDLQLTRLDMSGGKVRADWKCTSSVFPCPMEGYDLFDIEGGKIKRLEIVLTVMPDMGGH